MKDLRISIHAPRVGRDTGISSNLHPGLYFNPRAPCGARRIASKVKPSCGNFNPRAPCGARRHPLSILPARHHHFNPRAPCGARLFGQQFGQLNDRLFQSTRPGWGATRQDRQPPFLSGISIHAPRVGRDTVDAAPIVWCKISIHAPRVGRDFVLMRAAM